MQNKILYLDHFNRHGGAQEYIIEIINNLVNNKAFLPIIKNKNLNELLENGESLNFSILSKTFKNPIFYFDFLKSIFIIRKHIKLYKINIIHSNSIPTLILSYFLFTKIPVIFTCHDVSLSYFKIFWVRLVPNKIIAVSNYTKSFLIRNNIKSKKVVVIYNGLPDSTEQQEVLLSSRKNTVLTFAIIGRIVPWKGLDIFLKAANLCLNNGYLIKFVIIGTPEKKDYKNYLEKKYCSNANIKFLDHINSKKELYNNIDIIVNSSIEPEPLGRTLIEAGIFRKPCIGPNLAGPSEIIINGFNGLLFERSNYKDLRDKFLFFYNNREKCLEYGLNNRSIYETKFSSKYIINKIENEYEKIMNRHLIQNI